MQFPHKKPTTYDVLRAHGVDRRDFLDFCTRATALMGLAPSMVSNVVMAMMTEPRLPVIWLHGLECTCCSESFLRASHPMAQDIILNLISLDYDDTLQVAAGAQAEQIRKKIMQDYAGQYILAVEGNAPTKDGGVYCIVGGDTFQNVLEETARNARAVVAWGSCATSGCVQAASPNPTGAKPVSALVTGKPVINVPGCPPLADVMAGLVAYVVTQGKLPELDSQGRPSMYFSKTVHEECERKDNFEKGRFVQNWDDAGARRGWCLFKMGCRGPVTRSSCSTMKWNSGTSWPVDSGHPCIGCSEANFWDANGPLYQPLNLASIRGRDHEQDDEEEDAESGRVGDR